MKTLKQVVLPILLATVWISVSEFTRNELLFKHFWTDHYARLGMTFPSEPVNGMVWGLWALVFSIVIYLIGSSFSLLRTASIAWLAGFVMMWLVVGNLGVLPYGLLVYAVPLSMLEAFVAAFIIQRLRG